MKSVNNENTKILELQQEAIKNKKRLHDERLTNSQEQSKSSKEILDEFLQSSSKIKNQNNFSKSNSISSAIIKFIEDLKKSINENHSFPKVVDITIGLSLLTISFHKACLKLTRVEKIAALYPSHSFAPIHR